MGWAGFRVCTLYYQEFIARERVSYSLCEYVTTIDPKSRHGYCKSGFLVYNTGYVCELD